MDHSYNTQSTTPVNTPPAHPAASSAHPLQAKLIADNKARALALLQSMSAQYTNTQVLVVTPKKENY